MRKNILKLSSLLLFATIFVACDGGEEDVNYTPQVYDTVAGDLTAALLTPTTDNPVTMMPYDANRAVEVQLTSSKEGIVYYAVDFATAATPTGAALVNDRTGYTFTGKESLSAGTMFSKVFEEDILWGGYEYALFAVMASPDGYLSPVSKTLFTTPDTSDPMFLRDDSNPAFTSAGNSPFAPVTFTFDEPVFYQGGDITFSGFNTGRVVTVSGADITGSGTTNITVAMHGTFAPEDFQIVTWPADTFKDNAGKSVAELSGFSHYFSTRAFTLPEEAIVMQGQYDYSTVFYGGLSGFYAGLNANNPGAFISDTGSFEVVLDDADPNGLTLKGINLFSGFANLGLTDEPQTLPMILTEDPWASGFQALGEMEEIPSVITAGQPTFWSNYEGFFGPNTGGWRLGDGTDSEIIHYVSLFFSSGGAIDDIDYIYTRAAGTTYTRGNALEDLEAKSKEIKGNHTNAINNPNFGY